jgi:hypothetical protein
MISYSIETKIVVGKRLLSRTNSTILSEQAMKIGEIKSYIKNKTQYTADEIESEKFEGEDTFTNDNVTIQPQKWLVYTITLKK